MKRIKKSLQEAFEMFTALRDDLQPGKTAAPAWPHCQSAKVIEVLDLIFYELAKAEEKYPAWPKNPVHAAALVAKESREAGYAALNLQYHKGPVRDLRTELAQTAAMAIRALQHL